MRLSIKLLALLTFLVLRLPADELTAPEPPIPLELSLSDIRSRAQSAVPLADVTALPEDVIAPGGGLDISAGTPAGPGIFLLKTNGVSVYSAERILVKPLAAAEAANLSALHSRLGTTVLRELSGVKNLELVKVPAGITVEDAVAAFNASGLVEYAELEVVYKAFVTPNDPSYSSQWALPKIQAPSAWDKRHDAPKVIVGLVDTGTLYTHPELAGNIWTNTRETTGNSIDDDGNGYIDDIHGIDATLNKTGPKPWPAGDPGPLNNHGTMTAGIIGAIGNNGTGIAGICWNVKIMPLKAAIMSGLDAAFPTAYVIEAIDYALENGASVINCSFGGPGDPGYAFREILTKARNRGVVVVAALGNDGVDDDNRAANIRYYPASWELDNLVSVGATDANDARPTWSNYGGKPPVTSSRPGTTFYRRMSATVTRHPLEHRSQLRR